MAAWGSGSQSFSWRTTIVWLYPSIRPNAVNLWRSGRTRHDASARLKTLDRAFEVHSLSQSREPHIQLLALSPTQYDDRTSPLWFQRLSISFFKIFQRNICVNNRRHITRLAFADEIPLFLPDTMFVAAFCAIRFHRRILCTINADEKISVPPILSVKASAPAMAAFEMRGQHSASARTRRRLWNLRSICLGESLSAVNHLIQKRPLRSLHTR